MGENLTCQPESRHPLELRLLEPFEHPPEGFPTGFELGPRLGVPQEVGQRSLGPTEYALRKDGLGDAVPLQLGGNPLRQLFRVDLFDFAAAAGRGGGIRRF